MQLKLMSFNINGIRARPHQLEQIRDVYDPDIIGLQEIKVHSDVFPEELVTDLGWHVEHFGQKGHYGVALVSKTAPVMVQKGYPTDDEDAQRRFIHARYEVGGRSIDVMNGYFPQGESRDHPTKFPAKRAYYADLNRYVSEQMSKVDNLLLMGDMNISPQDCDIGIGEVNAKRWLRSGKCSFLPEEREWYDSLLARGLYDTYRAEHGESNERFSWFDYRSKGFDDEPKRGLRIDHLLATKSLLDRHVKSGIAYDTRGMEKPSDHAPVWSVFDWG